MILVSFKRENVFCVKPGKSQWIWWAFTYCSLEKTPRNIVFKALTEYLYEYGEVIYKTRQAYVWISNYIADSSPQSSE